MKLFGEKLKMLRNNYNMSQAELAEAMYVSRSAVAKWEQDRGFPNIDSLQLISNKFGVSIDELLSNDATEYAQTKSNKKLSVKSKLTICLVPVVCVILAICIALATMFIPRSLYGYIKLDVKNIDSIYVIYCKDVDTKTEYLRTDNYSDFVESVKKIKVVPKYKTVKTQTQIVYYLESGGKIYFIGKDSAGVVGKGKKYGIYSGDFYALLYLFGLELDDNVLNK